MNSSLGRRCPLIRSWTKANITMEWNWKSISHCYELATVGLCKHTSTWTDSKSRLEEVTVLFFVQAEERGLLPRFCPT
jgi:hypothetical protein